MDTNLVDTFLRQAADHVGAGPSSMQLAAVAETWTADKAAASYVPNVAETKAALLRAGQLRVREVVAVVAAATTMSGPLN